MATKRLLDQVEELEKSEGKKSRKMVSAVGQIVPLDGTKDKQISAKVNERMYAKFTQINKIQGMSNNSIINQLIYKYVRENRTVLDEETY